LTRSLHIRAMHFSSQRKLETRIGDLSLNEIRALY